MSNFPIPNLEFTPDPYFTPPFFGNVWTTKKRGNLYFSLSDMRHFLSFTTTARKGVGDMWRPSLDRLRLINKSSERVNSHYKLNILVVLDL